jgi:DUF2934 family protein
VEPATRLLELARLSRECPVAVVLDIDMFDLDAPAICRAVSEHHSASVLATMQAPKKVPRLIKAGCQSVGEIEKRAYGIFEARGREDGRDVDDWLEAEQEVAARRR